MKKKKYGRNLSPPLFLLLLLLGLALPASSIGADIGNCLLCHKYPGLSRIDAEGKMRLMYVNEEIFRTSVHAKVKCEGCHTDIKRIPHDPAKPVDCLVQCHIVEPSSEQKFSHKDVGDFLARSVHAKTDKDGNLKKYSEDLPDCKNCHDNPLYRPLAFYKTVRSGISEESLGRCRVCHKKDDFIFQFYNHITTRLHKSRSPLNIAQMCARCHDDKELVSRHGLKTRAFYSYGETFHGKAASFQDERIPDCLDCHVSKGKSVHEMLSHEDPKSAVNPANKAKICATDDCHPNASPRLATYETHPEFNLDKDPAQYYFTTFFIFLTGGTLLPLMLIMFLDMVRRLFPHAMLGRRK